MMRFQDARVHMRAAEAAFVQAAREHEERPGPHTRARYDAAVESLLAAYDTMRLVDPRLAPL